MIYLLARSTPLVALVALLLVGATAQQEPIAEPLGKPTTWQQKEHGKLFRSYRGPGKLTQAEPGKDISVLVGGEAPVRPYGPNYTRPSAHLSRISCSSDAIVIGTLTDQVSALTEYENFIFTDATFIVESILKNNDRQTIRQGAEIVVTRPGGQLRMQGRWIRAEDNNFQRFQLRRRYVLYLRFIPATGAYQAFADRSFELGPQNFRRLTKFPLWNESAFPVSALDSFLSEVRFALTLTCPE